MQVLVPGSHGSTYGGNPLGCKVASTALDVLIEEGMIENAEKQGVYFRKTLEKELDGNPSIKDIRGLGFMNCIELNTYEDDESGYEFCFELAEKGLLCKNTHGNRIRFTPPLIINRSQVDESVDLILKAIKHL